MENWVHEPGVIVVRYEDLLKYTYNTLVQILINSGPSYDEDRVKDAIQAESFSARKKAFAEQGDQLNRLFMRRGKSGDWRRFLTKAQANRLVSRHRNAFELMGYED